MRRSPTRILTIALLLLGIAAVLWRVAWVGDDALITLRTVYNQAEGHGLRWNVAERVQTYTHPLWMMLLATAHAISGEFFYGTIWLSGLTALAAALVLLRLPRTILGTICAGLMLVFSAGFFNFATSGLENPLSFLLLGMFATIASAPPEQRSPERRLVLLSWLTGFALITRMDLLLICAPAVLVAMRGMPLRRSLWRAAIGSLPFVMWSLFAAIYYGSPFPITAYAKLNTGVPAMDILAQGLHYVVYVAKYDPLTLVAILLGITAGLAQKALRCRALAIGALLYCAYIIKVGGDFMGSRFASVPFIVALAILARAFAGFSPRAMIAPIVATIALAFVPGIPQWMLTPDHDKPPSDPSLVTATEHGIVDERCFYYDQLGMLSPTLNVPKPGAFTETLRQLRGDKPVVWPEGQVGRKGFEAGVLVHVVDPWLCDPLLMRLPIGGGPWRIGHFIRDMPTGYLETLARGENVIHHPGLARYYDNLRLAIRGPVFDKDRLTAVWRLWTGAFDDDLRDYVEGEYRRPPRIRVRAAELANPVAAVGPVPPFWFDDARAKLIYRGGLEVTFDTPQRASQMHAWLQGDKVHRFTFMLGDQIKGEVSIDTDYLPTQGLNKETASIPAAIGEFDRILVDALKLHSHDVQALGGLLLAP